MRFDKLTAKFQQALAEAQSLVLVADSSYLETGFVLKALLDDQNSEAAAKRADKRIGKAFIGYSLF
ncbi:hypothetical protein [Neisseria mucosa]|jgi:chaperone protein clpB|uniref:hypothetical protein n=1 Tax=Neisseria mucosa TaxID=488 RepID=UPI00280B5950|nr:hypothetical protein [Neisseria mucosa]